jgi:hypothetical protein
MYTIIRATDDDLETQVRRVVSKRHREGRRLPEFFLSSALADRPPVRIDGFLVLGTRLVAAGELCVVAGLSERPGVRYVNSL